MPMIKKMINCIRVIAQNFGNNTKLKYKLILSFSLITVVSVFFVGFFTSNISRHNIMDMEQELISQSIFQLNNNIENFFEIYMSKSEMIFDNTDLQNTLSINNTNMVDQVNTHNKIHKIVSQITNDIKYSMIKNSFYTGGSLKVTIYTMNDSIIPNGEEIMPITEIKNEDWCKDLFNSSQVFSWQSNVVDENGTKYVTINRKLTNFNNSKDIGVLSISIPIERIRNVLVNNMQSDFSKVFFLDDKLNEITQFGGNEYNINFEDIKNINFNSSRYFVGSLKSDINGWTLVYIIPMAQITNKINVISTVTFIIAVISLLVCIVIALAISEFISRRINILLKKTNQIKQKDFKIHNAINGTDEIGQLDQNFNDMVEEINNLIEKEYKWKIDISKMQVELLQEQINPHLLYNSLTLISMVSLEGDCQKAYKTSNNLVHFYKDVLSKGKVITAIKTEFDIILRYINIVELVYGIKIDKIFEISDDVLELYSIKLFLQPIVENAIIHGIKPNKAGILLIRGKKLDESLEFTISDNGIGMPSGVLENLRLMLQGENIHMGYGISNVEKRIKLFFGEQYGINVKESSEEGTTILIRIPLISQTDMKKYIIDSDY